MQGDKVKFSLQFRGREMQFQEEGSKMFQVTCFCNHPDVNNDDDSCMLRTALCTLTDLQHASPCIWLLCTSFPVSTWLLVGCDHTAGAAAMLAVPSVKIPKVLVLAVLLQVI